MFKSKKLILIIIAALALGYGAKSIFAQTSQTSQSSLYVPLIGISSVPQPLTLPNGPGNVTYYYAVKNFLRELSLTEVGVVDDKCSPVKFVGGDDNGDSRLDYSETWRYVCTTKVSETTQSIATATGGVNDLTATHKAYATVVVGSKNPPPLVSVINVTKVAYPLSLPAEGGQITFTYRVNNPGVVPLSDVTVADDKCSILSGRLGDINYNNLLDTNEVWIYACSAILRQTTTNTVRVEAFANGLRAVGEATITVVVDQSVPSLPDTGWMNPTFKITAWGVMLGVLAALSITLILIKKNKLGKKK